MREDTGERTEEPTQKRLEEAVKQGQFARSAEVQTVFVFAAVLLAITFAGQETWRHLVITMSGVLGHLHQIQVTFSLLPSYAISGSLVIIQCVWPIVVAAAIGGLLAGGVQSHFQTASEALAPKWERLDPMAGLQRIFSFRSAAPTGLAILKLVFIIGLSYSEVRHLLNDPIFYSSVDVARIAGFLAESAMKIFLRVTLALVVIASLDYYYQFKRTRKDLMMTKEEIKEESKNSEGNPHIKAMQRRKGRLASQRKMLLQVPHADVVVTNPTHFAVALKYDAKTMKAPRIVAKGARLHALRIRELAQQHQVPIVENKPLARMMFKYGKVDGEVPAQLYTAVAEILAWVYRVNRYRYYTQANQTTN